MMFLPGILAVWIVSHTNSTAASVKVRLFHFYDLCSNQFLYNLLHTLFEPARF